MYDGNFEQVLKEAESKYQEKKKVYGESWKTKTIAFLQERLHEEEKELLWAEDKTEAYNEALDVINLALMVAERLRPLNPHIRSGI